MTKVEFDIYATINSEHLEYILEGGNISEAVAHNNHRYIERFASELLEKVGLGGSFVEDNYWDDSITSVDISIVYPNLDSQEIEQRIKAINEQYEDDQLSYYIENEVTTEEGCAEHR